MKRSAVILLAALFLGGCVKMQLHQDAAWEKAPAAKAKAAEDARLGRFHLSMDRMMDLGNYLLETEGFLFVRRDDDAKTFVTDPFKLPGQTEDQVLELGFVMEDDVCVATWKHSKIVMYKPVDVGADDPAYQKALADDWNWRLFRLID